jgi:hypothetical protein
MCLRWLWPANVESRMWTLVPLPRDRRMSNVKCDSRRCHGREPPLPCPEHPLPTLEALLGLPGTHGSRPVHQQRRRGCKRVSKRIRPKLSGLISDHRQLLAIVPTDWENTPQRNRSKKKKMGHQSQSTLKRWRLAAGERLEGRACPALLSITGGREVTEGTSGIALNITLSEPLATRASVVISTAGSTAALSDFSLAPRLSRGLLVFRPGETSKTLTIATRQDVLREPTERIVVSLIRPTNVQVATQSTTVQILDDDSYSLSMTGPAASVAAGQSAAISIRLSSPATKTEYFRVSTIAESAKAGIDFTPLNRRTVPVPRGATSATVLIPIRANGSSEKTFVVNAISSTRGTPSPAPVRVSIGPSAPPQSLPVLTIAGTSITEGNPGAANSAVFTLSLSAASSSQVAVAYQTAAGSANTQDYTASSGVVTFAPGQTTATVSVPITADSVVEGNESFSLVLSAPVNCTLGTSSATATIVNDDVASLPSISIADASLSEGNSGTATASFALTLSFASSSPVTVNYNTTDETAAAADGDYYPAFGAITFQPGELQKIVSVAVVGDTKFESDDTFAVTLSSPVNSTLLRARAVGTIRNDDSAAPLGSWTIMVYMTGHDLNNEARNDINEMEWALSQLPSSVNIAVSWDQWAGEGTVGQAAYAWPTGSNSQPAWNSYGRSLLKPDTTPSAINNMIVSQFDILPGDRNTGDPNTLIDFMKWGAQQAPAERYLLMMWGHGGGLLGSNFDPESSGDEISVNEMAAALGAPGVPTFDIVGYDNCVMGMTEIAYALSAHVPGFFLGSQEDVPGYGHDYTTVFGSLTTAPRTVSSEIVAQGIVDSFQTQKNQNYDVLSTYSAIRSSAMPALAARLSDFVASTQSFAPLDWAILRIWTVPVHTYGGKKFADLGQFLGYVANNATVPAVAKQYAAQAKAALDLAVIRRTSDAWNSTGLSIYLRSDGYFDSRYDTDAPLFIAATGWSDFIFRLNT